MKNKINNRKRLHSIYLAQAMGTREVGMLMYGLAEATFTDSYSSIGYMHDPEVDGEEKDT